MRNEARRMAVCLGREVGGHTLLAIADYFAMEHISGNPRCVEKIRETMVTDTQLLSVF